MQNDKHKIDDKILDKIIAAAYKDAGLIERLKIYPITILGQLTKNEKQKLLNQGFVTCLQILNNPEILDSLQLSRTKYIALEKEINEICS